MPTKSGGFTMAEILPSIFGADILRLKEEIDFLEQEDTPILHVDMMDGNFVSNIAFGPNQIAAMKKASKMTFDVHMMTAAPKDHLDDVPSVHGYTRLPI